jgi:pyruvate dehydrogenase E2 component (dihydrolipoamide acetyltransferase)
VSPSGSATVDVVVPKVGLTVERAEVLGWHKAVGDPVEAGEPLVDLAADKSDLEIEAPGSGVLSEILAQPGDEVALGSVIGRIAGDGSAVPPEPAGQPDAPAASADGAAAEASASPVARRAADHLGVDIAGIEGTGPRGRVVKRDVERVGEAHTGNGLRFADGLPRSSPAARALAADLGVPLAEIASGSGPLGRIVEFDVRRQAEAAVAPAAPPPVAAAALPGGGAEPLAGYADVELHEVRWTAARRTTAKRMSESAASVAPVTLHRRADARAALAAVAALKGAGMRASFTHVLMHCVAKALAEHPAVNAVWDGDRLLRVSGVHLGLAVDADDQLLVPVVRDAHALTVRELAEVTSGLVARCRSGTLRREDVVGATFTISNLGMLGVEQFTPIVNPPQVAVLGVGAVTRELVAMGDGFAPVGRCHLSLTFDHRAVDGAPAARFLDGIVTRLEQIEVSP